MMVFLISERRTIRSLKIRLDLLEPVLEATIHFCSFIKFTRTLDVLESIGSQL